MRFDERLERIVNGAGGVDAAADAISEHAPDVDILNEEGQRCLAYSSGRKRKRQYKPAYEVDPENPLRMRRARRSYKGNKQEE